MSMRSFAMLLLSILLVSASGCKTPEDTVVGKPPAEGGVVEANRPSGPQRIAVAGQDVHERSSDHPEPLFGAAVWPYIEESTTFELSWGGQPTTLQVYEMPDLNGPVVGEYSVAPDQEIPWRATWVDVYEPAVFTASQPLTIEGTVHAPHDRDVHDTPASEPVTGGEPVAVYHYQGAATCFIGVKETLLQAGCPNPQEFEGDFSGRTRAEQMHPRKRLWWVYLETTQTTGWIIVDDRFVVDIIST
jgi:hypothetical protein